MPQFSLRNLLVVVSVIAILLALMFTFIPGLWSLATETEGARLAIQRWTQLAFFWRVNVIPYVLVLGIGTFMLVRPWRRHPQVCLCALVGIGGLFLLWGADLSLRAGLFPGAASVRASRNATDVFMTIYPWYRTLVYPLLSVGCWSLILLAIVGWRDQAGGHVE
jgi:hypothetical protein